MKDRGWIGRLVEFRGSKTLGESYSSRSDAIIYQGRIRQVFRKDDGRLYAMAELLYWSSVGVGVYNTKPDPNWTPEQYERRRHHKAVFYIKERQKLLWRPTKGELLIRYKGPRWKPVKI